MTVILKLPAEVGRQLEEKAVRSGKTLAAYLEQLAENEVRSIGGFPQVLNRERRVELITSWKRHTGVL